MQQSSPRALHLRQHPLLPLPHLHLLLPPLQSSSLPHLHPLTLRLRLRLPRPRAVAFSLWEPTLVPSASASMSVPAETREDRRIKDRSLVLLGRMEIGHSLAIQITLEITSEARRHGTIPGHHPMSGKQILWVWSSYPCYGVQTKLEIGGATKDRGLPLSRMPCSSMNRTRCPSAISLRAMRSNTG